MRLIQVVSLVLLIVGTNANHEHVLAAKAVDEARNLRRVSRDPYNSRFKPFPLRKCPKPIEGDKTLEDRICEAQAPSAPPNCGCQEVCRIWGDPHVAPFSSQCSEVAMFTEGWYPLYEVPASLGRSTIGDRTPIRIEGEVTATRNRRGRKTKFNFVTKVSVAHGQGSVDADPYEECDSENPPARTAIFSVEDDCMSYVKGVDNPPAAQFEYNIIDHDDVLVNVYLDVRCAYRVQNHRHNYLNVTIRINDQRVNDEETVANTLGVVSRPIAERTKDKVPDSTVFFDDDFGVCTDPLRFGSTPDLCEFPEENAEQYLIHDGENPFWLADEACRRPSGTKEDGIECSCRASCAAYGDPHVYPFNGAPDTGNDFMADVRDPEFRVIYSLNPYFSFVAKVDQCAFVTGMYAVYTKLNPNGRPVENGDISDKYEVETYLAEDICNTEQSISTATRTRIRVPDIGSPHYTEQVHGFNAGKFLVLSNKATMYVTRPFENDVMGFIQSQNVQNAETVVSMGGVQAILKCHITKAHRRAIPRTGTRYFNVCIERTDVFTETIPDDDGVESRSKKIELLDEAQVEYLMEIEKLTRSDGFCAVGDIVDKKKRIFTFRKEGETELYPYNPEVELSNT